MSRDLTRAADLGRALPLAVGAALMTAAPAAAQLVTPFPIPAPPPASAGVAPITIADGLTLKPLADLRIRYENVHQDGIAKDADAVTARLRPGVELATRSGFSALVEAEGTLPIDPDYNSSTNGRTAYAGVSDPRNVELNRAQVQYRSKAVTITAGRQLIALDDQRFVGPAAWRQNEQTFDAVRVEAKAIGPFFADVAYSWSDRTIYGITADKLPATSTVKQAIGGDNVFAGAGVKLGPLTAKGFAYLVDQDAPGRQIFSSQTYGIRASAKVPAGPLTVNLLGSYARQSDYSSNPTHYAASYWIVEGSTSVRGVGATVGYEVLGADGGGANTSFQTPLASLHKFNGYADKFTVTPADGLTDLYATVAYTLPGFRLLPGLAAGVTYHRFDSDRSTRRYGDEWDPQVSFRLHTVGVLVKYATYTADTFATDTRKFWIELDWTT